jgi:hypothetical protein
MVPALWGRQSLVLQPCCHSYCWVTLSVSDRSFLIPHKLLPHETAGSRLSTAAGPHLGMESGFDPMKSKALEATILSQGKDVPESRKVDWWGWGWGGNSATSGLEEELQSGTPSPHPSPLALDPAWVTLTPKGQCRPAGLVGATSEEHRADFMLCGSLPTDVRG